MSYSPSVKHVSECFIQPKHQLEEAQKKPIYLASWDLAMLSVYYIQKGLLFRKPLPPSPISDTGTLLGQLKDSLSVALVHFYPLAGQLETQLSNEDHNPRTSLVFIDPCKGPGARFIHATLDLSISDLLSPTDVPLVVQSLFDHDRVVNHDGHTQPLLTVQVTQLVDGIFIGCSINHVCADGTSYWHFFNSWSEIFMKKFNAETMDSKALLVQDISRPPIHTRFFLHGFGPVIRLPFVHADEFITLFEAPQLRERIFHLSSESIRKIKAKANSGCGTNNISSFQALSALVWRCITRARRLPADQETTCRLAINNRSRLNPPLSNNYFGNCIQTVHAYSKVKELLQQSLGWAALMLNHAVAAHNDKVVRGMVEGWIRAPQIYQMGSFFHSFIVMMGSSPRFDIYGNEFGMGKAVSVLSGYAHKFDGKVTSYPGREGGGSVDLEICLLPDFMSALESDEEFMSSVS